MKKVLMILILLVISTVAWSTDLSKRSWGQWPSHAYRAPLPPDAIRVLAPPGAIDAIKSASKGWIWGKNSCPEWVWATVCQVDGYKKFTPWRYIECGNPAKGGWKVKIYCPPPVVEKPVRCIPATKPAKVVVKSTTNVVVQMPAPEIFIPLGQPAMPTRNVRYGYTVEKEKDVNFFLIRRRDVNVKVKVDCPPPKPKEEPCPDPKPGVPGIPDDGKVPQPDPREVP